MQLKEHHWQYFIVRTKMERIIRKKTTIERNTKSFKYILNRCYLQLYNRYSASPQKLTCIRQEDEWNNLESNTQMIRKTKKNVTEWLSDANRRKVLMKKFKLSIYGSDVQTLKNSNWLNDNIINFYLNMIAERSQRNELFPSVYVFNTFFMTQHEKYGYKRVNQWTKKNNLFNYELLLIPFNCKNHWILVSVDVQKKMISGYDSINQTTKSYLQMTLHYLNEEKKTKHSVNWMTINGNYRCTKLLNKIIKMIAVSSLASMPTLLLKENLLSLSQMTFRIFELK